MSTIICRRLSFGFDGTDHNIFSDLNLTIDTAWRTCVAGKNGRGKTTLLQLIDGQLMPDRGIIEYSGSTHYFPKLVSNSTLSAFMVAKTAIGSYVQMEQEMERLLQKNDEKTFGRYTRLQDTYVQIGGYEIDARLSKELKSLGFNEEKSKQSFGSLSGGEQTRCMLAALFVQKGGFALIDEPTNHLDQQGRELVANYLKSKQGFLLVSHDRSFMDACTDHVLALNADSIEIQKSSYSKWRRGFQLELRKQESQNADLKKEIKNLDEAADERRFGAAKREEKKSGALDKGFEGARAARQMKRALAIEKRCDQKVETRKATRHNVEKHYPIKINHTNTGAGSILCVNNLVIQRPKSLFSPISFSITAGARLAIKGKNGSGKTSLLDLLCGKAIEHTGTVALSRGLTISRSYQQPLWRAGNLQQRVEEAGLDITQFRIVMATLGVRGNLLEQAIESLSLGQIKKLDIARTLVTPSDLIIWDEPLNFIDIDTREQIELAIQRHMPTMIFVEHDESFISSIATDTLELRLV